MRPRSPSGLVVDLDVLQTELEPPPVVDVLGDEDALPDHQELPLVIDLQRVLDMAVVVKRDVEDVPGRPVAGVALFD